MSPMLGQQIIIENKPGAATNLAAGEAARAEPDGYTLFTAGIETLVYNPALYKKLPFDPDKDLRPVGLTARFHLLLTVKKDSTIKTAQDLVARLDVAKAGVSEAYVAGAGFINFRLAAGAEAKGLVDLLAAGPARMPPVMEVSLFPTLAVTKMPPPATRSVAPLAIVTVESELALKRMVPTPLPPR